MQRTWQCAECNKSPIVLAHVMDVACLSPQEQHEYNEVLQRIQLQPHQFSTDIGIMSDDVDNHYQPAIDIIAKAIDTHRKICVVYDYDCDGITAGVSLVETLKALNADVCHCVPDRIRDGYGMNTRIVRATSPEPCLVVTVDNGITCVNPVNELNALGYEVVVTDHHLPEGDLPNAACILNPKCYTTEDDDEYMGSGCYVAAKLSMLLLKKYHPATYYPEDHIVYKLWQLLTCLTGLSIISDIIPFNRTMSMQLQLALTELALIDHVGIRALCDMANIRPNQPITSEIVAFYLAPKINSAGRIGDASVAFRLLSRWHTSPEEQGLAYQEATALSQTTTTRKVLENEVFTEVNRMIENQIRDNGVSPAFVMRNDCWHPGVTGIVASRVVEQYGVPCILISKNMELPDATELVGSCRAPEGYDLKQLISICGEHLIRFGGHKVACGFTVDEKNVESFTTAFLHAANDYVVPEHVITYHGEVSLSTLVSVHFQQFLNNCAPNGKGNPSPIVRLNNLKVLKIERKANSLNLLVCKDHDDTQPFVVLSKYRPPVEWEQLADEVIDVLCTPVPNYYNRYTDYDYRIVDIRIH